MSKPLTPEQRRALRDNPCGGYTVARDGEELVVTCRACGPSRIPVSGAHLLAAELRGLLGRFQTRAPRPERARLADLIDAEARS